MAEKETVYRLKFDINDTSTEEQRKKLELLKKAIIETENEVKALKTETKGNAQAQVDAAGKFSQLETKLFKLKSSYGEVRREAAGVKGFTDKIGDSFAKSLGPIQGMLGALGPIGQSLNNLTGRVGAIQGALKGFGGGVQGVTDQANKATKAANGLSVGFGLAATGVVAAIGLIASQAGELFTLAQNMELVEKKAKVLFGESFDEITRAAEENANAIGLTTNEYLKLAASQQTVFQAIGLTKDQTVELIPNILDLSDKLADFSSGQLDTAQAADLLKQAIQGNVKGLSELGIPIKKSGDELAKLSQELQATGKYTKDQADSLASYQLVVEQLGPTLDKFSQGEETLADKTDKVNARFREQKETLANSLAPAFNYVTSVAGDFFDVISAGISGNALEQSLAGAKLAAEALGNSDAAAAIDATDKALKNATASAEKYKNSVAAVVNEETVAKATLEELTVKYEELISFRDAYIKQGKDFAVVPIQQELDLISKEIDSKKSLQDAQAKLGLSYDQLSAKLSSLQEARKTINENDKDALASNQKEQEAVKDRLKVFDLQTKKLNEGENAYKKFTDAQSKLLLSYQLTTSKMNDLAEKGFINEEQKQQRLLELELKTNEERQKIREEFASSDGKVTTNETQEILTLQVKTEEARKKLDEYEKYVKEKTKDVDQKVEIELALKNADINKEISDSVAADTIRKEFDDVFAGFANSLGQDVKDELKAAAIDGTINFDGLANVDIPLKEIEKLKKSFFEYKKTIESNEIKLNIEKNDVELERLNKIFNELNGRKIRSEVDIDVKKLTPEEEELFAQTREDIKTTRTVNVKLEGDLAKIQDLEIPSVVPEDIKLGISDDDFNNILETYSQLNSAINDVFFQAQQERIQSMLDRDVRSLEENYQTQNDLLKASLDQNLITQAEYEQQRKENQSDLNAQRFKLESDAFKKEQKIRKAEATLNYFGEISNLAFQYSKLPPGVGQVLAAVQIAIATARYAGNIAQIQNAVPPTAERGAIIEFGSGGVNNHHSSTSNSTYNNSTSSIDAKKLSSYFNTSNSTYGGNQSYHSNSSNQRAVNYSYGGVPIGPRHSDGGIKVLVGGEQAVEMEGGEAVINRKSTARFRPLLSQINSYGGFGRKFATGGVMPSEPISLQPSPELFGIARRDTINIASEQVQQQVVLYISELENKQSRINRTKDRVSFG